MGVNGVDPLGLNIGAGMAYTPVTQAAQEGVQKDLEIRAEIINGLVEKPAAAIDTYFDTDLTTYDERLLDSLTAYELSYLNQGEDSGWTYYLYGSCYMVGINKIPTQFDWETLELDTNGLPIVNKHGFWKSKWIGSQGWLESLGTYYGARWTAKVTDKTFKAINKVFKPSKMVSSRPVLSGHGSYSSKNGYVEVPQGTSVTVWTEHGNSISNDVGKLIEANRIVEFSDAKILEEVIGARTYLPGAKMPNCTLHPIQEKWIADSADIFDVYIVDTDTLLSELLGENMGNVNWAACLKVTD